MIRKIINKIFNILLFLSGAFLIFAGWIMFCKIFSSHNIFYIMLWIFSSLSCFVYGIYAVILSIILLFDIELKI